MATKFFGQLAGLSAFGNQFDRLLAKLRRIWRFGIAAVTDLGPFLTYRYGVRQSGQLQPRLQLQVHGNQQQRSRRNLYTLSHS